MAKHIYLCSLTFSSPDISMNQTIFCPETFHVCLLPLEIWMHWPGGAQALQKGVGTNGGPVVLPLMFICSAVQAEHLYLHFQTPVGISVKTVY